MLTVGDMRLPNADRVIVDREKITEYLLNQAHRYGASKARFFGQVGFELAAWGILAEGLREHAHRHEVSKVSESPFGPRYEIAGELYSADGRARLCNKVFLLVRVYRTTDTSPAIRRWDLQRLGM